MQLNITGPDYKQQTIAAQFLGYRPGITLLAYVLKKPLIAIQRESKVSVRIGLQSAIIQFDSVIEHIFEQPFFYMHLRYPPSVVVEQQLRQSPRFDLDTPLKASAEGAVGRVEVSGRLLDISSNGARIAFKEQLFAEKVTLSSMVFVVGMEQELNVIATVKSVASTADSAAEFVYGARFIDVSPAQKLLLQALCYELQAATPS
ncbi:MAG: hypothetical protein JWM78_1537 [Verrucomicrobiaceae bacterium]|nr:hypothetical protein [Verrucomicrobiaceae bacterium]